MICLGDSNNENASGVLKLLEVLLSSEREAKEKKRDITEWFFNRNDKDIRKRGVYYV